MTVLLGFIAVFCVLRTLKTAIWAIKRNRTVIKRYRTVIDFKGRFVTLDALGRKRDAWGTVFERTGTGRSRDGDGTVTVTAQKR